jgi:hypothetical protein
MAKTTTRTTTVSVQQSQGGRGRAAEFLSEPTRVSEGGQAHTHTPKTTQKFDFTRSDDNKLPARPSTSGGASASRSRRKVAEQKESRDDLHLKPLAAHGRETTFFDFPLPGTTLSPANTPKASPLPQEASVSNPVASTDAKASVMSFPQAEIGMALGSPTHQPIWQPQDQQQTHMPNQYPERFVMSPSPDIESSVDGIGGPPEHPKHKTSRWKVFGGLFGGSKKQSDPQTFYQVKVETGINEDGRVDYTHFDDPPSEPVKRSKSRPRAATSEKKTKEKLDVKRSQTAPVNYNPRPARGRSQTAKTDIRVDHESLVEQSRPGQQSGSHGGLLLNVDIPTTQLERYSVMFGSVLQKPTNTTTTSSLLARRQATLDRLKTLNDALASKVRQSCLTSSPPNQV